MSGNSDGTNDPTASGTEPPWPDPSKSSWGYQDPYQQQGYGYPTPQYHGPIQPPSDTRSGISVWWIVGGAALLAIAACGFGVLIAQLFLG